jgi:hypothetical protein
MIQSSVYGKCIFADYNNVRKDMCVNEFMKLKECYLVSFVFERMESHQHLTSWTEGVQATIAAVAVAQGNS